jgi:WD40 repeat protein
MTVADLHPSPAPAELATEAAFDAFISYSRKDIVFARALEKALRAYRSPRGVAGPRRHLRVFRDEADFTGGEYTEAIRRHLKTARKLIVLCSPAARASRYVDEEIRLFAGMHGVEAIVPVLVAGIPNNEGGADEDLAFPPSLCQLMTVPLAADYRGFDPAKPRPDRGIHESAWFKLLADLYGLPRSEIEQREKRRQALVRRRWIGGTAVVVASLASLSVWALASRAEAIRQGEIAAAGLLTAQARALNGPETEVVERQALLAIEAIERLRERGAPTDDAETVLSTALERLPQRVHVFAPQSLPPMFAFSGDGLHLFRAAGPRIEAWNTRSMTVDRTYDVAPPLARIDVSGDAQWLAAVDSGGSVSMMFVGEASALASNPDAAPTTPPTRGSVAGTFSDDGALYATLHRPGEKGYEVLTWAVNSGEVLGRLPVADVTSGSGAAVPRLSFNQRTRIGTGAPTTVLLTFPEPGNRTQAALAWSVGAPAPHRWKSVVGAAFGRDGDSLLLTRPGKESTRGELVSVRLADWSEQTSPVASVGSISPDGRRFLTFTGTAEDPYVHSMSGIVTEVRDTLDGSVRVELAASGSFSAGGDRYLTVSDRLLRIFDLTTGDEVIRVRAARPVAWVRDSRGGRYVALGFADNSVEVWDTGHPKELSRIASFDSGSLVAGGRFAVVKGKQGARLVDIARSRGVARLMTPEIDPFGLAPAPVVSPDGTRALCYAGLDGKRLVDLTQHGRTLWQGKAARQAAFSPDGDVLVVDDGNGMLRALNARDGTPLWQLRTESSMDILDFAPMGRDVVVGGLGAALLVDAATGKIKQQVQARATAVSADPGGMRIAAATSEHVAVASTGPKQPLVKIVLPKTMEEVAALAFMRDGKRIVTVAGHKEYVEGSFLVPGQFTELAAFVWDASSAELLARIPSGSDRAANYVETLQENEKAYLADAVVARNGRAFGATVFRSRGDYWTVKEDRVSRSAVVWDLEGTLPREIMRRPRALMADISDDGEVVLVAMPQALEAWSLARGGLEDAACVRVSRNLDASEWKAYFGDRPYHATCSKSH